MIRISNQLADVRIVGNVLSGPLATDAPVFEIYEPGPNDPDVLVHQMFLMPLDHPRADVTLAVHDIDVAIGRRVRWWRRALRRFARWLLSR